MGRDIIWDTIKRFASEGLRKITSASTSGVQDEIWSIIIIIISISIIRHMLKIECLRMKPILIRWKILLWNERWANLQVLQLWKLQHVLYIEANREATLTDSRKWRWKLLNKLQRCNRGREHSFAPQADFEMRRDLVGHSARTASFGRWSMMFYC